jgi:uncharacterized membrane protein YjjP (DUF1212 family)/uncharacterized membrane protein YjjB (DUF3815 family)
LAVAGELMAATDTASAAGSRRRAVRLSLRLGTMMLGSGAQADECETNLREVMRVLGLSGGDAIVTSSSVTVSYIAPGDAETTTAIRAVREWRRDFGQLDAVGALVKAIREGAIDAPAAEVELDRIGAMAPRYPAWLRFGAPAVLSAAVTILFGGSVRDSLATFGIGLAIQPAQAWLERGALPVFFQIVFGVAATVLLVVLLALVSVHVNAGLVLTGGLLRFLPGAQLVAGMRDLIAGAIVPGAANLAEVMLHGVAVSSSAAFVLAAGQSLLGVDLGITIAGAVKWPAAVTLAAGATSAAAYCVRLGVPPRIVPADALLAAAALLIGAGLIPAAANLDPNARTLAAALMIGAAGRFLAHRWVRPVPLFLVPSILPLLPSPVTLLPRLAGMLETPKDLLAQALTTAFLIGAGVASGDILVAAYQRRRERAAAPSSVRPRTTSS